MALRRRDLLAAGAAGTAHPASAIVGAVLATTGVWLLTYAAGGSHTVFPHLFYIPILFTAVRFGLRGAVVAAVLAGLAAGPLMPADSTTGEEQTLVGWGLRLVMFVGISVLVAWMTRNSSQSLAGWFADHRDAARLRSALGRGEITVHYQPTVSLVSGRVLGFEALARWEHPTKGMLPPMSFIPAAERSGAILDLDRFVLGQATRDLSGWAEDLWVAVNVSASRFAEPGLVDDVRRAVADAGLRPDQVHLEITETAIIRDVDAAAEQISALRAMGVLVAVDDFGAGRTSLSYLHQFGVDVIKIDRSFVAKTVTDPRAARLVGGVIRLFNAIGTDVIGEGISDAEEYVQMQSLGCEIGQGFYLGRPGPASAVPGVLEQAERRRSRRRAL